MKKAFIIIGICFILFLSIQTFRMYASGSTIPQYNYLGLDGKYHTNIELTKNPTLFIYFSPDCGYCEKAIVELSNLHRVYKSINYIFVSSKNSTKVVSNFVKANKVDELTPVVLIDNKDSFPADFGLGMIYGTPTILVYDSSGKFVQEVENYKNINQLKF